MSLFIQYMLELLEDPEIDFKEIRCRLNGHFQAKLDEDLANLEPRNSSALVPGKEHPCHRKSSSMVDFSRYYKYSCYI
jgi:hypothetical protein